MLLAEDLLLLLTDDESGKLSVPAARVDLGLGGANLVELALRDRVGLGGDGEGDKPGRLLVRDPTPTGDPLLDAALAIVGDHAGRKPSAVIRPLARNLRVALYEGLAEQGVVRAQAHRALGLFPTRRWPSRRPEHEAEVRRRLVEALMKRATPDARTAALIALLHALGCEDDAVDAHELGLSKGQVGARAEEIARGDWASGAVRAAVAQMVGVVAGVAASSVVVAGAD